MNNTTATPPTQSISSTLPLLTTEDINAALAHALELHQQEQVTAAESLYRKILNVAPYHADALHLLGVIETQYAHFEAAVQLIGQSLAIHQQNAAAHTNYGNALLALDRASEAISSYDLALTLEPDLMDAHYNRGNALLALKRYDDAEMSYARALKINPNLHTALMNRGNALLELGRAREALASYDQALTLNERDPQLLNNRGNALLALDRLNEALASYERALSIDPNYLDAAMSLGNTLFALKRYEEALERYERVVTLNAQAAGAHYNIGNALLAMNYPDAAYASYNLALEINPEFVEAWNNRGQALLDLDYPHEAVESYDRALALKPSHIESIYSKGTALLRVNKPHEALAYFNQALDIKPDYAEALTNRGNAYWKLNDPIRALASYDRSLALRPDYAETFTSRGNALRDMKRFDEALASYAHALNLDPNFSEAHWNEGLCRLLMGDFERGWRKYEWRWETKQLINAKRSYHQPVWSGQALQDKTILVYAEQGLGDTIQFSRYIPLLAAEGANVTFQVPAALKPLMSQLDGVGQVIAADQITVPDFDYHVPLLSLARIFATGLETIPANVPYLKVESARSDTWAGKLGNKTKPRIGLAWAGAAQHVNDHNRSIPLNKFESLLNHEAQFISLQKELRESDSSFLESHKNVTHIDQALEDFEDTAALIAQLDLVITVDTAIAHLAGALGKPVWILLSYIPDWRWLLDRNDSPWYPTARLFRQSQIGDWDNVMQTVSKELEALAR